MSKTEPHKFQARTARDIKDELRWFCLHCGIHRDVHPSVKVVTLELVDEDLKMLRETMCTAQYIMSTLRNGRGQKHSDRIQRIINEIDRQRPLGSDGKHGNLHTKTCGCEDK